MSKQFILKWERELGFRNNPFKDCVLEPIDRFIVGLEEEKKALNMFFIKNKHVGIIRGEQGSGKTTLIKWLRNHLKSFKTKMVVSLVEEDALDNEDKFVAAIIGPMLNIFDKNMLRKPEQLHLENLPDFIKKKLRRRKLVLLIDDVENLSEDNRRIISLLNSLNIDLIFIATATSVAKKHHLPTKDELKLEIKKPTNEELLLMIEKRIAYADGIGVYPFTDKHLKEIFAKCKKQPHKVLNTVTEEAIKLALNPATRPPMPIQEKQKTPLETDKKEDTKWKIKFVIGGKKGTHKAEQEAEENPDELLSKVVHNTHHDIEDVTHEETEEKKARVSVKGKTGIQVNESLEENEELIASITKGI